MAEDLLNYLPEELLIEILYRLPTKTLLRFTCVCKSWYSLLTSPRSIKNHLGIANNNVEKHVLLYDEIKWKYHIHKDNEAFDKLSDFDTPFEKNNYVRNVGTCNGIICIYVGGYTPNVYLWNPSIRRLFRVPHPPIEAEGRNSWGTIGFGYIPETNEYKIVNIKQTKAIVYELGIGSWKEITNGEKFFAKHRIGDFATQCFLNDTIHWVGSNYNGSVVVTFKVKNEEFGVLLSQDSFSEMESENQEKFRYMFCIWVMNERNRFYRWMKKVVIERNVFVCSPLTFRHNGDALLISHLLTTPFSRDLVSFDPINRKYRVLLKNAPHFVYADYFVQSLVLLDKRVPDF